MFLDNKRTGLCDRLDNANRIIGGLRPHHRHNRNPRSTGKRVKPRKAIAGAHAQLRTGPLRMRYRVCSGFLILIPLLGHHALVWMVGFRMAGFMLSGSGIRVFVLENMGLGWGGWGKVQVNDGEGYAW